MTRKLVRTRLVPPVFLFLALLTTIATAFSAGVPLNNPSQICSSQMDGTSEMRAGATATTTKHILYDMPVSNNGARCRLILYKKALPETEVKIVAPSELGGLKSEEYLKVNPQGKMPSLVVQDGDTMFGIAESDTIGRYLMSTYATTGPSFQPDNPRSNLIARFHDLYLSTIQGCFYKPSPPFGTFGCRKEALLEYRKQLDVIADLTVDNDGLYLCGSEVSYADATLFPSLVFAKYMFPKFDGVPGLDTNLPIKLGQYFDRVLEQDPAFRKIYDEVRIWQWKTDIKMWWSATYLKDLFLYGN